MQKCQVTQMQLSTEKKRMDLESRLAVVEGEEEGVGWNGRLGLIDVNYDIWNERAMRSCCTAQGTISSHLRWNVMEDNAGKRMYIYTCV